jgi:hypothetical protein
MPEVRRASHALYQRSTSGSRPAEQTSASFQLAPGGLRYTTLRCDHALDVPLPHDLVGDLIPVDLLSHTLHSSSAVPRPRVHVQVGEGLRV